MTATAIPIWENKRTAETRQVEDMVRQGAFEQVDAYRYNSATIRVRVIDSKFEGRNPAERDQMVETFLHRLPERTQADIVTLFTFAPSELTGTSRESLLNAEFMNPSRSEL